MADQAKTKSENYDALGGIFDFIFEESKKPPQQRRPVRPKKPISTMGNEDLADNILAALAAPGVFISDSAVEAFNDATDYEIARLNIDQSRNIKFTTRNIIDLFKDPDAFMKKASDRAKAQRKAGRALFLGRVVTDFIVTGWARKYGNKDILDATLAMSSAKKKEENYKKARAMGQYLGSGISSEAGREDYSTYELPQTGFMVDRAINLAGQDAFREDWENLSLDDKTYFTELLVKGDSRIMQELNTSENTLEVVERGLARRFGSKVAKNFDKAIKPISKMSGIELVKKRVETEQERLVDRGEIPESNKIVKGTKRFDEEVRKRMKVRPEDEIRKELITKGYRGDKLEEELVKRRRDSSIGRDYGTNIDITNPKFYIMLEEAHLQRKIGESKGEDRRAYQRALYVVKGYKADITEQISNLKNLYELETDPNIKKKIRAEINEARSGVNLLNAKGVFAFLGKSEGYINSLRNVWLPKGGNVFQSIFVNQNFFDERLNTIANPLSKDKISAGKYKVNGKKENWSVEFLYSKGGSGLKGAWNDMGEVLYYGNPKTWIRTLYTGEGFAWLSNKRKLGVSRLVGELGDEELSKYVKQALGSIDLKDIDNTISSIMNKIKLSNKNGKLNIQQLQKLEKLLNSSAKFKKLARTFSTLTRFKTQVENYIKEKVTEVARQQVLKFLEREAVKKFIIKYGGQKALATMTKFAAEGSIKVALEGLTSTIAAFLGLPATPVGSAIAAAITAIAVEIVWRVGKLLIKTQVKIIKLEVQFFSIILLGFIGMFFLMMAMTGDSVSSYNKIHFKANQTVPKDVKTCSAYGFGEDPQDDDVNCRKNVPIPDIPCLNVEETIKLAKTWLSWQDINTSTSHVEECLGDVLQRSLDAGIDPIFSVAIWIHESAASNYDAFNYPIEDFGIHGGGVPTNDFNAQIEFWLNYPDYVYGICVEHNLENFIAYYWFGNPSCEPESQFEAEEIQRYISELEMIYSRITNGGSCSVLPNWPSDGSGGGGGGGGGGPDAPDPQPPVTDEECIIGTDSIYCTQGWKDVHCWSHQNMKAVYPVDLGYVNTITAPQFCGLPGAECKVTSNTSLYCYSKSTGGDVYQGGIVDLYASYGGLEYNFHLIHVQLFQGVTVGKQLGAGEGVASVEKDLTIGNCWTGKHLHISVKQNGGVVDPLKTLQSFNCQVPNEGGCADSPCCVNCACQDPCITNCSQCP